MRFLGRLIAFFIIMASLVVLALIASSTYYKADAGEYVVIYSRTDGYSLPENLPALDFKRLLPFNLKVLRIPSRYHVASFKQSAVLNGAELFAQLSNNPAYLTAFSYTVEGSLSFRLTEQGFLQQLERSLLTPDSLDRYYSEQEKLIAQQLSSSVEEAVGTDMDALTNRDHLAASLADTLKNHFKYLEFSNISFTTLNVPEASLYQQVLGTSLDHLKAIRQAQQVVQLREQTEAAEQQARLKLLSQYGELLTQYPILIQFFAIDQNKTLPRDSLEAFMPAPEGTS